MTVPVELRNVSAGYGLRDVIRNVNFQVDPGECVGLIGPNGSGKSTLLNVISGAVSLRGGDAFVFGGRLTGLSAQERAKRIAFVPQSESAPFAFTVREIVAMGRIALSGALFETREDERIIDRALTEADCVSIADRPLAETSGGEQQRALIARALAQEAPLMLLDEPTSHLDIEHQFAVARLVRRHVQQGNCAVCAVHDLNLLSVLADRVVLLSNGEIIASGTVEDVLHDPQLDAVFATRFRRIRTENRTLLVAEPTFEK